MGATGGKRNDPQACRVQADLELEWGPSELVLATTDEAESPGLIVPRIDVFYVGQLRALLSGAYGGSKVVACR